MDDGEMYLGWSWIMPSYRKFPKYHNPQAAALLYEGRTDCFVWRPRLAGELNRSKQTMRVEKKQKWADTPVQSRTGHSRTPPPLVLTQVKSSRVLTSSALLKVQKLKFSQSRLVSRGVTWHVTSPLPGHVTRDTLLSSSVTTSRRIYPTFMTNGMMLSRFCHLSVSLHRWHHKFPSFSCAKCLVTVLCICTVQWWPTVSGVIVSMSIIYVYPVHSPAKPSQIQ